MAEKIKLKISPQVAAFVRADAAIDEKFKGLEAAAGMASGDRVLLLFCLMRDSSVMVREAAGIAFGLLPEETLVEFVAQLTPHPAVLDVIVRHHYANPAVSAALLSNEALSPQARAFLQRMAQPGEPASETDAGPLETVDGDGGEVSDEDITPPETGLPEEDAGTGDDESAETDESGEEFLSKFKMAQLMGIGEKIKMALSGDKEWRTILVKDANKLVSASVIKNPRITEAEVLSLIKAGVQNDEIMRLICANKEWIKNYLIRKALVENPRTPIPNALRYLASLGEKDIAAYAKSKNISSVISTQAKRILLNKKR